jgi:protein SCO1/2
VGYYNLVRTRKQADEASRVEGYGKPLLGGPWSLVDGDGVPRTSGDYLGQYVLLYFGFTFCPDICPNELVKMAQVVQALDATPQHAGKVTPMFISLDPYRDTCEQVKAYCADFHPRMVGLTGTPGQVAKAAKAYRVYFSEVDRKEGQDNDDYLGAFLVRQRVALPRQPPHASNSALARLHARHFSPCSGSLCCHIPAGPGWPVH